MKKYLPGLIIGLIFTAIPAFALIGLSVNQGGTGSLLFSPNSVLVSSTTATGKITASSTPTADNFIATTTNDNLFPSVISTRSTTTSATTTNLFSTNFRGTDATTTTFFATTLQNTDATTTGLLRGANITATNATSTNFFATTMQSTNATSTTLFATTLQGTNATTTTGFHTTFQATNATTSSLGVTGAGTSTFSGAVRSTCFTTDGNTCIGGAGGGSVFSNSTTSAQNLSTTSLAISPGSASAINFFFHATTTQIANGVVCLFFDTYSGNNDYAYNTIYASNAAAIAGTATAADDKICLDGGNNQAVNTPVTIQGFLYNTTSFWKYGYARMMYQDGAGNVSSTFVDFTFKSLSSLSNISFTTGNTSRFATSTVIYAYGQ